VTKVPIDNSNPKAINPNATMRDLGALEVSLCDSPSVFRRIRTIYVTPHNSQTTNVAGK